MKVANWKPMKRNLIKRDKEDSKKGGDKKSSKGKRKKDDDQDDQNDDEHDDDHDDQNDDDHDDQNDDDHDDQDDDEHDDDNTTKAPSKPSLPPPKSPIQQQDHISPPLNSQEQQDLSQPSSPQKPSLPQSVQQTQIISNQKDIQNQAFQPSQSTPAENELLNVGSITAGSHFSSKSIASISDASSTDPSQLLSDQTIFQPSSNQMASANDPLITTVPNNPNQPYQPRALPFTSNSMSPLALAGIITSVLFLCILGMAMGYKKYSAHQKKNLAKEKFKALKRPHVDSLNSKHSILLI